MAPPCYCQYPPPPPKPCTCRCCSKPKPPPNMVKMNYDLEIDNTSGDVPLPGHRTYDNRNSKRTNHGRGPCFNYYDDRLKRIPSVTYYVNRCCGENTQHYLTPDRYEPYEHEPSVIKLRHVDKYLP